MRTGILAAGNFIRDYVKIIDHYPEQDMLVSIRSESTSNGGGPYNVLVDLAEMGVAYPLEAAGLVGRDANGEWILRSCAASGIDVTQLRPTEAAPTSYTDAMTVASTGRRTFFHQRGANALFADAHLDFSKTQARLFYLGFLMLLDAMDEFASPRRTHASLALEKAVAAGLITAVDMVSTENPRFREIAESALPYTDYLIVNEIEAGKVISMELKSQGRIDLPACIEAAKRLLAHGVRKQAVIHFTDGAVVAGANGQVLMQGSLQLSDGFIAGATGAGDAFAAGYLHGVHEGWDPMSSLRLAVCASAACLTHPTSSGGLRSVQSCLALGDKYGYRIMD